MKIVVLDGFALNPGDLSWDSLKAIGNVEIFERTQPDEIIKRAAGVGIILTNKTILSAETLKKLPDLKYIGVLATGYNVVDLNAAKACGIVITNIPDYSTRSVAQHVFALILDFFNGVGTLSQGVRNGRWSGSIDFSYWDKPLTELAGKTIGIIGFGRIGKAVSGISEAMGMRVIVSNITETPGYENLTIDDLLKRSDIVTLHCPLTPETKGIINADRLKMMKPTALLVNTARGPLVAENDLAEALNVGIIAGAALDVLSVEPPSASNPLLRAKNCIITPHVAWATLSARKRLLEIAVDNIKSFLNGQLINVVNGQS
jgi:glycerate dehydrogenase